MNKIASIISGGTKRRRLLLIQLFIVAGFLALLWFSFGQNVLAPRQQAGLPEQLGALVLVSNTGGSEALAQVDKLHGTDIKLTNAYVVVYAFSSPYQGSERATVWVGRAETSDDAAELTNRMAERIAAGNSAFSNLQRLSTADQEVFQVEGPGGKHFFYHSLKAGENIIWLTIEADDAMPILEQAIKAF